MDLFSSRSRKTSGKPPNFCKFGYNHNLLDSAVVKTRSKDSIFPLS